MRTKTLQCVLRGSEVEDGLPAGSPWPIIYDDFTRNLNMDTSTVWRMVDLFHRTGSVTKKKYDPTNLYPEN